MSSEIYPFQLLWVLFYFSDYFCYILRDYCLQNCQQPTQSLNMEDQRTLLSWRLGLVSNCPWISSPAQPWSSKLIFTVCAGRDCSSEKSLWTFLFVKIGGKVATSIWLVEVRDTAKYPLMYKTVPNAKTNDPAPNITSAKVEKSCPRSCISTCWSTVGYRKRKRHLSKKTIP